MYAVNVAPLNAPFSWRTAPRAKDYEGFKSARDIDPAEFRPTDTNFGGVYSMSSWRRFLDPLPAVLSTDFLSRCGLARQGR